MKFWINLLMGKLGQLEYLVEACWVASCELPVALSGAVISACEPVGPFPAGISEVNFHWSSLDRTCKESLVS